MSIYTQSIGHYTSEQQVYIYSNSTYIEKVVDQTSKHIATSIVHDH